MRNMVECTPVKVLQLFFFAHDPSDSHQFAYKYFGCYAMANEVLYFVLSCHQ